MPGGVFYSLEHEKKFAAARARVQRGGPDAAVCGARTKAGATCKDIPVQGSRRCFKHSGWKVARERRERQREAFLRGLVSADEWHAAEDKRARNRLQYLWKKSPWLPGQTIDLGPHEITFAAAVQTRPNAGAELAPAILDWLRWKYRRLQIDRQDDGTWHRLLVDELPKRLLSAGPPPHDWTPDMGVPDTTTAVQLDPVGESTAPFSKRQRPDAPKAKRVRQGRSVRGRGRPPVALLRDEEAQAIMMTCAEHHAMLTPLLERCASQGERDAVIRALHDYLHTPGSGTTAARWWTMLQKLRA